VDIGKRNCKACIMNSDGSIAEESVYNNTLAEAEIFAYSMVKKYGRCVAVNTAARKDDRLKKFYIRIAKRHGHNIAITHVANKMVTIIWYMLVNKKTV
jgi:hypothetical protein